VPGIENRSPLWGEKEPTRIHFHGLRGGGLRRAAALPVATARRPEGAFKAAYRSDLFKQNRSHDRLPIDSCQGALPRLI
jgi:hypothetical protein